MSQDVYINRVAGFLPGEPIDNEQMEEYLGRISNRASRARPIILKRNGIKQRYYVLDPNTGKPLYNNAQLTAEAVRRLQGEGFDLADLQCLACGTSSPDQLMPNHGVMVHGELGNPPCEVAATSGICVSGITSLKYTYMSVLAGLSHTAVATGSEIASTFMQAKNFQAESDAKLAELEQHPEIAFEKDFLRWMLSDGAGAMLLQNKPNPKEICFKLEWIEQISYANELPACMYSGAEKCEDGQLTGWREYDCTQQLWERSVFSVKQDVKLLNEHVIRLTVERGIEDVIARHPLKPTDINWFLPHYSSAFFRDKVYAGLRESHFEIPFEKWHTNLAEVGNVGSASIYLMLESLIQSAKLSDGDKILCYIPESGRFSTAFMLLSAIIK